MCGTCSGDRTRPEADNLPERVRRVDGGDVYQPGASKRASLIATAKDIVWLVPASALFSLGFGFASVAGSGTASLPYALVYVLAGSVTGLVGVPILGVPTLVFLVLRRQIRPHRVQGARLRTAALASAIVGSITLAVPLAYAALTRQDVPDQVILAVVLWAFGTPAIYGSSFPSATHLVRRCPERDRLLSGWSHGSLPRRTGRFDGIANNVARSKRGLSLPLYRPARRQTRSIHPRYRYRMCRSVPKWRSMSVATVRGLPYRHTR